MQLKYFGNNGYRRDAPAGHLQTRDNFSIIQDGIVSFLHKSFSNSYRRTNKIDFSTNLKTDLCLDSLDIVELMVHLENKYKIEFEGEELPPIETVDDLARHTFRLVERANMRNTGLDF